MEKRDRRNLVRNAAMRKSSGGSLPVYFNFADTVSVLEKGTPDDVRRNVDYTVEQ